jgi:polynucleotide 5'-hydroxyl-kinase GRC3/NOL9
MTLDIPAGWRDALDGIVVGRGTCMVIGRVDAGKTTLCGILAAHALAAGVKVALVDADPGQSDIGPPAAVGMAIVKDARDLEDLESMPADGISFIGTTSPGGHLLQLAAAAHEMVVRARAAGAELVIVDTSGLVDAGIGRALKAAKVDLLRPRHIAALQRKDEVEHLLAPYRTRDDPKVWRLPQSRATKPRDRDERKAKRERQFAAYFTDAMAHELAWDDVGLEQTLMLTGKPVPGHMAAYVEELAEGEVVHAERIETGIFAIVKALPGPAHRTIKGEELDVRAVDAGLLQDLLVGLMDGSGHTLAMGVLTRVDYKRRRFFIQAPIASIGHVRGLRFGAMRVSPEGIEIGHGEIA